MKLAAAQRKVEGKSVQSVPGRAIEGQSMKQREINGTILHKEQRQSQGWIMKHNGHENMVLKPNSHLLSVPLFSDAKKLNFQQLHQKLCSPGNLTCSRYDTGR